MFMNSLMMINGSPGSEQARRSRAVARRELASQPGGVEGDPLG